MRLTEPESKQGWVQVIRLEISDAEPMGTSAYGGGQFMPTEAILVYQGGSYQPVVVRLKGPMLRSDGSRSSRMAQGQWPSTHLRPETLQAMIDQHTPEWL